MFGTTIDQKTKFAAIEADLVSAHALGVKHLHAEIFNKFAELIEDEHDIEAALDALFELENPPKIADGGFGGFGSMRQMPQQQAMGGDLMGMLAKAVMLAGPIIAGAKFLGGKADHDRALQQVQQQNPQLFQQNPQRATALFEAVYSSAPNIGKNAILMGDLLKQLMSMPMVDMGTIARLTEISKNTAGANSGGGNPFVNNIADLSKQMTNQRIMGAANPSMQKAASATMFPAKFKAADGRPTVFNWKSEAAKQAGLTDAFTGSGTNMEQANQATMMNQQESGNTMLPLDSVLHELLMKEMELQQREQNIMQQEQQLQQAMQAVQHIGSQYQGETGVDPNTGAPAEEPMAEEQPAAPMGGEEDPAAMGGEEDPAAAMGGEEDPAAMGAEDPAAMGAEGAEDPAAMGSEAPAEETTMEAPLAEGEEGAPVAEEEPVPGEGEEPVPGEEAAVAEGDGDAVPVEGEEPAAAEGGEPPIEPDAGGDAAGGAEGEAVPEEPAAEGDEQNPEGTTGEGDGPASEDGTPAAEGESAGPAQEEAPVEEDPAAALPPAVDTSPEAVAAGQAGLADAAAPMPPADQVDAAANAEAGDAEAAAAGDGEAPAAGATMDPFSAEYSEGGSIPPMAEGEPLAAEGEEPPATDAGGEGGEEIPGDEKLEDEEEDPAAGAEGPNTAESVEGSVEDNAKDQALNEAGIMEGSPEEAKADEALAEGLNEAGETSTPVTGDEEIPADDAGGAVGEGAPAEEAVPAEPAMPEMPAEPAAPAMNAMPPIGANDLSITNNQGVPQGSVQQGMNGHEIVLPLRITVKIGEVDPMIAMRADATRLRNAALLNLPKI